MGQDPMFLSPRKRSRTTLLVMGSMSTTAYPEVEDDTSNRLQPLYHVILLNDEDHTYDYVIALHHTDFRLSEAKSLSHAVAVDTKATPTLLTCELENAGHKPDQVHRDAPDRRLSR